LLARPNVGGSPSLTSHRPGGWTPPAANRSWDRPAANLVAKRNTTVNGGHAVSGRNVTANRGKDAIDHRPSHWKGRDSWHHHPRYGFGSYYAYSYYPSGAYSYDLYGGSGAYDYGSSYYPDYSSNYSYYGAYRDAGSSGESGSSSDQGYSGDSYRPARPASSSDEGAAKTDEEVAVERTMARARGAFQKGDYAEAQRECEQAIHLLPGDANLLEFRALCQFALGEYTSAAASLYDILAAGPGWGWDVLSSFYGSAKSYTTQLRALERFVKQNPDEAAPRLVLAYHYLALDERDDAAAQLRQVVKLESRDEVAPVILAALEKSKDGKDEAPARRPAPGR
jgi:tetratricopeptide (TPR) repeat protein